MTENMGTNKCKGPSILLAIRTSRYKHHMYLPSLPFPALLRGDGGVHCVKQLLYPAAACACEHSNAVKLPLIAAL